MTKWVYSFGKEHNEGDATMCNLLGGKGANLAEMAGLGLPVPPGFTITTEVCTAYYENEEQYPAELKAQLEEGWSGLRRRWARSSGMPRTRFWCLCALVRAYLCRG